MDWHGYIQRDPAIMLGKPVVRGTRITVELILERLGDGWSEAQVLESFPSLKAEHIRAAQSYAAEAIRRRDEVRSGSVHPIPGEQVLAEVRRVVGR